MEYTTINIDKGVYYFHRGQRNVTRGDNNNNTVLSITWCDESMTNYGDTIIAVLASSMKVLLHIILRQEEILHNNQMMMNVTGIVWMRGGSLKKREIGGSGRSEIPCDRKDALDAAEADNTNETMPEDTTEELEPIQYAVL